TGMANHQARAYGWSPQGDPCWGEKPGHRTQRVSLIDALHQHQLRAPLVFEGYCDTALFEAYVEHVLVPLLHPGQIVIYDNARCHQSAKVRQLLEEAGCPQQYLPPSSQGLNPIDHYWFRLKQRLRKYRPLHDRTLHSCDDTVL